MCVEEAIKTTEGGEDWIPDGHLVVNGLDSVRRADAADFLVLKTGEHGAWRFPRGSCRGGASWTKR